MMRRFRDGAPPSRTPSVVERMKPIEIYTKSWCSYCHAAKELLRRKGWTFTEIDVTTDPAGQKAMSERAAGRTSVPQIFFGDEHIEIGRAHV